MAGSPATDGRCGRRKTSSERRFAPGGFTRVAARKGQAHPEGRTPLSGLGVLYAKEARGEASWPRLSARNRTKRLREVYWSRRAEGASRRKPFMGMAATWRLDRSQLGRGADDPGDGLIYRVRLFPRTEVHFDWIEVTEVFTTVPAKDIQGAMRALNGIRGKHTVDLERFLRTIPRDRPSQAEQTLAADKVIDQVRKKLEKRSYRELAERYGYGTLVVGMPLWFAVPPDDPFRPENVLDDFMTRIIAGLEELKRTELRKPACPFRKVVVAWDATPVAMDEWRQHRSADYDDVANASLHNLAPGAKLTDRVSALMSATGLPEHEMPSRNLRVAVRVKKRRTGSGPYPELVRILGDWFRELEDPGGKIGERVRRSLKLTLLKVLWFRKLHGTRGLRAWIARRMSLRQAWRVRVVRRRARRLYRKERR